MRAVLEKVAVFIDYQNCYEGAKRAFHYIGGRGGIDGQFDPLRIANHIASSGPAGANRILSCVRLYRGRPESSKDPKGFAANRRQCAAWEQAGCQVFTRILRYPMNWPAEKPEEKGIDVQLAIDFVMMGLRKEYDIGVLFSTDTDLKPALEATCSLGSGTRAEVAAWSRPLGASPRLSLKNEKIWCHWLEEPTYNANRDLTNYASP